MGMTRHTPSSLPRLRRCLGSAVLPWTEEKHAGTARGTALHLLPENIIAGDTREQALEKVPPEWRADAEEVDTEPFEMLAGARVEVGMAWHPATGEARILGERMSREQARAAASALGPGWMPMVVDVLGSIASASNEVLIIDWKHGRGEDLGPAADHWQLLTYAAVAMLALGASRARCFLAKWRGARWTWDPAELDVLDARAHLDQVQARLQEAADARAHYLRSGELPILSRGPWCLWCPSQRSCPAVAAMLVAAVRGEPALATGRPVAELTLANAGALLARLREIDKIVSQSISDLNALARREPLPMPDGRLYSPPDRPRVEPESAHSVLARMYGQGFADMAIPTTRVASLATIRNAVKDVLLPARRLLVQQGRVPRERATLRVMMDEVRSALSAAGALTVKLDVTDVEPESGEGDA